MNENQIAQEPIETGIDRSVYEQPYIVKDGCLYEEVTVKNKTEYVKLADFVPVLKAEITYDDGTEEKKKFLISAVHKSGDVLTDQLGNGCCKGGDSRVLLRRNRTLWQG